MAEEYVRVAGGGDISSPTGPVPRVSTKLSWRDHAGSLMVRTAVGRMRYAVAPGLYAVGDPSKESPVLVSANYKLSFDYLRKNLVGMNAWILVLDTKGINVWCAAGKGTFSTDEVVRSVEATRLAEVVSHRKLILPQLGAPGVKGHEVTKRTRFGVVFGPARASDIGDFLRAGMRATLDMRRVRFNLRDRAVLIPVELVMGLKPVLVTVAVLVLLGGLGSDGFSLDRASAMAPISAFLMLGAFVGAGVFVPLLLPWLPGRAFAVKGAWLGVAFAGAMRACVGMDHDLFESRLSMYGWVLAIPAVVSYVAMNFTGASTYTSLSGVYREMRVAVPVQIILVAAGGGLWVAGLFVVI